MLSGNVIALAIIASILGYAVYRTYSNLRKITLKEDESSRCTGCSSTSCESNNNNV
ncbi:hypothetical protein [Desulfuribacillus alkaliarsenatis]|uniref:hypothetical protein n=1 Tax=Desulfuribacillus alkaliarsenatis TaxID=766136 RepID=UPI00159F045E|nr:hypothetical protein [Desulfuribacillus alkaliarsenatis]